MHDVIGGIEENKNDVYTKLSDTAPKMANTTLYN